MATVSNLYQGFNSLLSLQPLLVVLKKMMAEGKPGAKRLYQDMVHEIDSISGLVQPLTDLELVNMHCW